MYIPHRWPEKNILSRTGVTGNCGLLDVCVNNWSWNLEGQYVLLNTESSLQLLIKYYLRKKIYILGGDKKQCDK